jgi:hypothetical protein
MTRRLGRQLPTHPTEGKINMARKFRWIGAITAVACLAGPGVAQAACPTAPVSKAFAPFGDGADYSLAPGGGFEGGTSSWTLNGNMITTGNEKYFASSSSDTQSLTIKPGGSVVSPRFCIDESHPTMRLFAKKAAGFGSLKVQIIYDDLAGITGQVNAGAMVQGGPGANGDYINWSPSPILKLGSVVPLASSASGEMHVKLRFAADRAAGDWAIDDVFIDPYRAG